VKNVVAVGKRSGFVEPAGIAAGKWSGVPGRILPDSSSRPIGNSREVCKLVNPHHI